MSPSTRVYNLALAHLGSSKQISNLETDKSAEGTAGRLFIDIARQELLRDYQFPFTTKIQALALIEEEPNEEWGYSYRYPAKCLDFRKIQSGTRQHAKDKAVPYRIALDNAESGKVIFTDQPQAIGEFTIDVSDLSVFPSDALMALSFKIAALIAPQVTKGDPMNMRDRMQEEADQWARKACANAKNEEQPDPELDSEFIRARL